MITLYYHAGSTNHGCEAIVRSTHKLIGEKINLFSINAEADQQYNLNSIVDLYGDTVTPITNHRLKKILSAIHHKISNNDYLYFKYTHENFFSQIKKDNIYMSIGGDNYCYTGKDILGYYNKLIHKKGGKTVLWGCSFEPDDLTNEISADLALYDLIVARESISYKVLKSVNPNTILTCDPAFHLDKIDLELPDNFLIGNTVGINLSPLILNCESNKGITKNNYHNLIDYILNNTNMNIALIPHVVEKGNDDRNSLKKLYDDFKDSGRICFIPDCNAMELKGYISRCRYFIGARTHATIAAYSTFVPTLVVGYSVKARGIAKDIFGTYKNYVLSVQDLDNENNLINAFIWLCNNESLIREHLINYIPKYKESILDAAKRIKNL